MAAAAGCAAPVAGCCCGCCWVVVVVVLLLGGANGSVLINLRPHLCCFLCCVYSERRTKHAAAHMGGCVGARHLTTWCVAWLGSPLTLSMPFLRLSSILLSMLSIVLPVVEATASC
jgi:hypothetical protein